MFDKDRETHIRECLERLKSLGENIEFPAGATVIEYGSNPDYFFVIKKGLASAGRITKEGNFYEYWVSNAERSDITIGLPSVLTGETFDLEIKALTDLKTIRIKASVLKSEMANDTAFAISIAELIAKKFVASNHLMHKSSEMSPFQRFCDFLYNLRSCGNMKDGCCYITPRISQQEMASLLKMDRTSIYRAIKRLEKMNILTFENGVYIIRDLEALGNI